MPTRSLHPCPRPGCRELTARTQCPKHEQESRARQDAGRPSAAARGYDGTWRRIRDAKLARDPRCEPCLAEGRITTATEVDHIVPLAMGGTHDAANLSSKCKSCHSKKTARQSGFARPQVRTA